jgi:transposase
MFRPVDRKTGYLFPPSTDEWLAGRHLARFVVDVVENLDLSAITAHYRGKGTAAYHPSMLLSLLIYGYASGVFSSRKLEQATYDSVAFRFIAANEHPDHDTIATFRKRFLKEIQGLFVHVLMMARDMGLLKMGTVGLDGTKIHANASRHSAMSYEYANKLEEKLSQEVAELLAKASAEDDTSIPDGMDVPAEMELREDRLKKISEAKAKIEARARERHARERAEYEQKLAEREAKEKATGKKARGPLPQEPTPGPLPKDQINFTDEESRIMLVPGGGFDQCYNAQAAVAAGSNLVVATEVTQAPNDKQQLQPILKTLEGQKDDVGACEKLLADTGYFSKENVNACVEAGVEPYIALASSAASSTAQ